MTSLAWLAGAVHSCRLTTLRPRPAGDRSRSCLLGPGVSARQPRRQSAEAGRNIRLHRSVSGWKSVPTARRRHLVPQTATSPAIICRDRRRRRDRSDRGSGHTRRKGTVVPTGAPWRRRSVARLASVACSPRPGRQFRPALSATRRLVEPSVSRPARRPCRASRKVASAAGTSSTSALKVREGVGRPAIPRHRGSAARRLLSRTSSAHALTTHAIASGPDAILMVTDESDPLGPQRVSTIPPPSGCRRSTNSICRSRRRPDVRWSRFKESFERAASLVDRIFKGAKPADCRSRSRRVICLWST